MATETSKRQNVKKSKSHIAPVSNRRPRAVAAAFYGSLCSNIDMTRPQPPAAASNPAAGLSHGQGGLREGDGSPNDGRRPAPPLAGSEPIYIHDPEVVGDWLTDQAHAAITALIVHGDEYRDSISPAARRRWRRLLDNAAQELGGGIRASELPHTVLGRLENVLGR